MTKWLSKFKQKVSDWYNDGDQFYLRTVVDPIIDLGKDIYNLGPTAAEYITPIYSDIQAGADVLEGGVKDIQNGNYLNGVGKVVISPVLAAASIITPDGMDAPLKAAGKSAKLDKPLYVYTGKQLGQKPGRGRPVSNTNSATNKPITMQDIIDAIRDNGRAVYENTSEEAIQSTARRAEVDKKAGYRAIIQKQDRKWARQKDPADAKRGLYQKTKKLESILPDVTIYLQELLASGFQPSKKALKSNNYELAWQEWVEHVKSLKYNTTSAASLQALNEIANNTWMKSFKLNKQGGKLNYLTLFS